MENSIENYHELPDINIKRNWGIRFVSKAVSVTLLIILFTLVIAAIIIFTVSIELTIDASGYLEPATVWNVHSPETAIIEKIDVYSGDTVLQGQKIANLISLPINSNLIQLKSELQSKILGHTKLKETKDIEERQNELQLRKAEAQLLRAKASFRERMIEYYPGADPDSLLILYEPGTHIKLDYAKAEALIAQAEISHRKAEIEKFKSVDLDLKSYENEIKKLNAQISILESRAEKLEIISPSDGIFLTEGIEKIIGAMVQEGALLFEIGSIGKWKVFLNVPENEIHQIKIGDQVKVEISALKTEDDYDLYKGVVETISADRIKSNDSSNPISGQYRVTVMINDEQENGLNFEKFKRGYSVQGNIITDHGKIAVLLWKNIKEIF